MNSHNQELRPEIPDHTLIRKIGEGAYGEVWLVCNALGQYRAVKIVYRNPRNARPFEREFKGITNYEPISRAHPNLVNILHVGINEKAGYFYYIMELADAMDTPIGKPINPDTYEQSTLSAKIKQQKRLPPKECLRIILELLDGLEYLHNKGLIHRDIKPSNIIFVNGKTKLADIGLVAEENDAMTIVGTAGYISPEGSSKPQSDIYSVGKVLYQISTGQDTCEFPSLPHNLKNIEYQKEIIVFNKIVIKACNNNPNNRYRTAKVLKNDLLRIRTKVDPKSYRKPHRRAISSLVFGSIGMFAWFIPLFGFPITITALVQGLRSLRSPFLKTAIVGTTLGAIGVLLTIINASVGFYQGIMGDNFFANKLLGDMNEITEPEIITNSTSKDN